MPLIKLDAIDSTNDFLKQLCRESEVKDYTIVMANEQTKGKGQMGAKWVSEKGKNLIMSILVKDIQLNIENIFDLNIAVTLAVANVLKNMVIPNVSIKWPNDIMADNKKVAGILIENMFLSEGTLTAVVGIGLNVNQTNFDNLPHASSLINVTSKIYDIENIALLLHDSLKQYMQVLIENPELLWKEYHNNLYKLNYPTPFEDANSNRFMGIIQKVTNSGKLQVLKEDDSISHYEVKEIKMLF